MDHSIEITVGGQSATARAPLGDSHAPCTSLYVHVPFCFHKCHYCDFYSVVDTHERFPAFVERLSQELRFVAEHAGPLRTIFVGGGTPTLLGAELWERLLGVMRGAFVFGEGSGEGGIEFTVECNPETATPHLMEVMASGGINRVSIGAQSFDERHLKTLERWHEPASVERALECAAAAGIERRSIDLIYAIPGQTLGEWERDLERALALSIDHVSCYALTYEPNTPMTARLKRGEFEAADEELEAAMFELTVERLGAAGFERYEVSNFARAGGGGPCRHNLVYWRHGEWLGAGPSASAHVAGHRWKNVARVTEWMEGVSRDAGASPIVDHEPPDARRDLAERLMMGIRLAEGLDEQDVLARAASIGCDVALARSVRTQIERGAMERVGARVRLTSGGFLLADGVASSLMGCVG